MLDAIRGLGRSRRPEADRDHARSPLAPRRPRGAEARERRDRLRARVGGRHRRRRPPRAGGHHPAEAVAEADPVPARALARPAEARSVPRRRAARRRRRLRPAAGAARGRSLAGPPRVLLARARFLIAGDAIATWPELCAGWKAFNLNLAQHPASLRRMATLEARIVGVGHGDPITIAAADKVNESRVGRSPSPPPR